MKKYQVYASFAKAGAPPFSTQGYKTYLHQAKDYFNMRSRTATNAKEIVDLSIIDDETISITFTSQEDLNITQVSRSLRVFSMYLIDKSHQPNFSNLITGKRLFRMQASELSESNTKNVQEFSESDLLFDVCRLIILNNDPHRELKLRKILEVMKAEG